jgi:hypothetical protein
MKAPFDSELCIPQADRVEDVCFGASFEGLLKGRSEAGGEHFVAWLDEGCFVGDEFRRRPLNDPLTARDLFHLLKKKASHPGVPDLNPPHWR